MQRAKAALDSALSDAVAQVAVLTKTAGDREKHLADAKRDNTEARARLDDAQIEIGTHKRRLEDQDRRFAERLADAEKHVADAQAQRRTEEEQHADTKRRLQEQQRQTAALETQAEDVARQLGDAQRRLLDLQRLFDEQRTSRVRNSTGDLVAMTPEDVTDMERKLALATTENIRLRVKVPTLEALHVDMADTEAKLVVAEAKYAQGNLFAMFSVKSAQVPPMSNFRLPDFP